jgi:hypothetical protein
MRVPLVFLAVMLLLPQCKARSDAGRANDEAPTEVAPMAFDAIRWKEGCAKDRIAMARQLVADRTLVGKSETAVTAMLGPGTTTNAWQVADAFLDQRAWHLGLRASGASLMFPYDEYLVVYLDDARTVTDAVVFNKD